MKIFLLLSVLILLLASFFAGHELGGRKTEVPNQQIGSIYEHLVVEGAIVEGRITSIDPDDVAAIQKFVAESGDLSADEFYTLRIEIHTRDQVKVTAENISTKHDGRSFYYRLEKRDDQWKPIESGYLYIIH